MIFITRYALALIGAFSRPINDLIAYCTPSCLGAEEELPGEDDDDVENDQEEGPPAEAPRFESELKLEEYEGMFDDYAEIARRAVSPGAAGSEGPNPRRCCRWAS